MGKESWELVWLPNLGDASQGSGGSSFLGNSAHGCIDALSPGEVPQVTVQPTSTVQKLGGTVILGCVVEPPWVNITWRFNGKELNGSDDALGVLVTRGTLVIAALNNHTVGRYQCVARIPAGAVASVPATVTLASESTSLPCCVIRPHLLSPLFSHIPTLYR